MSILTIFGGLFGGGGSSSGGSSTTSPVGGTSGGIGGIGGIGGNWGANITAIIEGGFNFSCWGSTHKPADGKRYLQTDIPKILQYANIENVVSQGNLELAVKYLTYYSEVAFATAPRFKSCSQKTLESCGSTAQKALDNLIASFSSSIEFVQNKTESVILPFSCSIKEEEFQKPRTITFPQYRIKSNDQTGTVSGTPTTSISYDENGNPVYTPKVVSNNLLFTLALGGAGLFYIANSDTKKKKK